MDISCIFNWTKLFNNTLSPKFSSLIKTNIPHNPVRIIFKHKNTNLIKIKHFLQDNLFQKKLSYV